MDEGLDHSAIARAGLPLFIDPIYIPVHVGTMTDDMEAFVASIWDSYAWELRADGVAKLGARLDTMLESTSDVQMNFSRWSDRAGILSRAEEIVDEYAQAEGKRKTLYETFGESPRDPFRISAHALTEFVAWFALPGDYDLSDVVHCRFTFAGSTSWWAVLSTVRAKQNDAGFQTRVYLQAMAMLRFRIGIVKNVLWQNNMHGLSCLWGEMSGDERKKAITPGDASPEQRLRNAEFRAMITDPVQRRAFVERLLQEVKGTREEQWEELGRRCMAHGMEGNYYKTAATFGNAVRAWAQSKNT